jgi:hypothetical protein
MTNTGVGRVAGLKDDAQHLPAQQPVLGPFRSCLALAYNGDSPRLTYRTYARRFG